MRKDIKDISKNGSLLQVIEQIRQKVKQLSMNLVGKLSVNLGDLSINIERKPGNVILSVLAMCLILFSCDKFLEENPRDQLPAGDVYNTLPELYLNAVA